MVAAAPPSDLEPDAELAAFVSYYNPDLDAESLDALTQSIEHYSQAYGLNVALVAGLVARESGFIPSATSHSGAQGLGQLMPFLSDDLGLSDPYDIGQNLEGTSRWLRTLYDVWVKDGVDRTEAITWALASYKQGLTKTREEGIPQSTADYINDIYAIARQVPTP
jgi:membrane-bound lytic murein transglycosylase MltF